MTPEQIVDLVNKEIDPERCYVNEGLAYLQDGFSFDADQETSSSAQWNHKDYLKGRLDDIGLEFSEWDSDHDTVWGYVREKLGGYRVEGNESDDEHCPDWRTEFRGTKEECETVAETMRKSGKYSEVQVNKEKE